MSEKAKAEIERLRKALSAAVDKRFDHPAERHARDFEIAAALEGWSDTRTLGEAWRIIEAATSGSSMKTKTEDGHA